MTAAVWLRGIMADEHGVPLTSCTFLSGGEEEPGRPEGDAERREDGEEGGEQRVGPGPGEHATEHGESSQKGPDAVFPS